MKRLNWDREQLWEGCILASIAHAIMVAHYPEFSHEQSWDDINYNVQDSSGTRGTITFHPNYLVGAFRNDNSERLSENIDALDYFIDAPEEAKTLAVNETLQYVLDDVDGKTAPVVTTAFWGNCDGIYSKDKFEDFIENGGFLIERQVTDIKTAINEWKEDYEMSETQVNLLQSVFKRKISNSTGDIVLTEDEIKMIESDDDEGLNESRISFEEIGIRWEK
ncbi:hypothetical protein J7E79_28490 [Bacillus sp. ISL-40]|uniref:hypothetical protein n=1 Tax=unclassified Bacillus (in: firmicutes) TaxID=185979 RepID=UPI001BE61327|nr:MULTISPECIES: hypothetical protein [unclassified Bacillus (in: firmicutes)]MBT2701221.1 hypothetical protein [Bacillus sp. ISL-40]MBT2744596.1 hypothetical protein [Bacillus sp. ISL-77]